MNHNVSLSKYLVNQTRINGLQDPLQSSSNVTKIFATCEFCKFTSDQTSELNLHLTLEHKCSAELMLPPLFGEKPEKNECPYCVSSIPGFQKLLQHVNENHKGKLQLLESTIDKITSKLVPVSYCEIDDISSCKYCCDFVSNLRSHLNELHPKWKIFECPFCQFKDRSLIRIICHFSETHFRVVKYTCYYCLYTLSTIKEFKTHLFNDHEGYCKDCSHCLEELMEHFKLFHSVFKCGYCDFKSRRTEGIIFHITHSHTKAYSCSRCDYTSRDLCHFIGHFNEHSLPSEKLHKCPECNFIVTNSHLLTFHFITNHGNEWSGSCHHCVKSSFFFKQFENHVDKRHLGSHLTVCGVCHTYMRIGLGLLGYVGLNHENSRGELCDLNNCLIKEINFLACPFCEKKIGRIVRVYHHIMTYHKHNVIPTDISFKLCLYCDFIFSSSEDIDTHFFENHSP